MAALITSIFLLLANIFVHRHRTSEWIRSERLRVYTDYMKFLDDIPQRMARAANSFLSRIPGLDREAVKSALLEFLRDLYEHQNELELIASRKVLDKARALGDTLGSEMFSRVVAAGLDEAPDKRDLIDLVTRLRQKFDLVVRYERGALRDAMRKDLKVGRDRSRTDIDEPLPDV